MASSPPLGDARLLLAVCAGACVGAVLRWRIGVWLNQPQAWLPWGTLLVNWGGGLLIGLLLGWFDHHAPDPFWRLFWVTGMLGALTTFSTFSAEVIAMLGQSQLLRAAITASAHLVGTLGLTWAGLLLGKRLAVFF